MSEKTTLRRNRQVWRKCEKIKKRILSLLDCADAIPNTVTSLRISAFDEQVNNILRATPVEALRKYKSGVRLNNLKRLSVMDIRLMDETSLTGFYGVGLNSASIVKHYAEVYSVDIKRSHKLTITTNDRTFYADNIIRCLFQGEELLEIIDSIKDLRNVRQFFDDDLCEKIKIDASLLRRIFTNRTESKEYNIAELDNMLDELSADLLVLEKQRKEIMNLNSDISWWNFINFPNKYAVYIEEPSLLTQKIYKVKANVNL